MNTSIFVAISIMSLGVMAGYPQEVAAKTSDLMEKARETEGKDNIERARILCPENSSELCNLLLNDPEYRDLWFKTADKVNQTDAAVKAAQEKNQRELEEILAKAPKLPDGTAIFYTEDGSWVDENGEPVSDQAAREAIRRQREAEEG